MMQYGIRIALMAMIQLPLVAMNNDLKNIRDGIYKVVMGCNDGNTPLYEDGICDLKQLKYASHLSAISFAQLKCIPYVEKQFLKCLVIKKEQVLLATFVDMYCRSYRFSQEGINFTYPSNEDMRVPEHTLMDVALTSFGILDQRSKGRLELAILNLLQEKGCVPKYYQQTKIQPMAPSEVSALIDPAHMEESITLENGNLVSFLLE